MTRSTLAVIAGLFAAFAFAQSTVPSTAPTNKEKQEMVNDATAGAGKGYGQAAAEGSAKAAESKGTAKVLPDQASKRKTVNAATANTAGKGYGTTAAEGSAKAAADTSPRKAKPKPKLNSPEMKEASKP